VLLLAKSFSKFSSIFVNLATNPTDILMAMTSLFKSYCLQKASEINGVKNKQTLELFWSIKRTPLQQVVFYPALKKRGKQATHQ
jgi:hypothetical protein